jgi:RNA polymerase sigma-70 factor (ECF subfamily)
MDAISAADFHDPVSLRDRMPPDAAEDRLVDRVRSGDREAAEALVRETYGGVFAALVRLCGGDRDLAADLAQETFRRAWEGFPGFAGRSRASTWLYRIAYNAFVNQLRRPRPVSLEDPKTTVLIPADPAPGAEEGLRAAQEQALLREAVLGLPEEWRFVVTARYWAALSVAEIAREEGVSTVAIRKRLRRALASLERTLEGKLS